MKRKGIFGSRRGFTLVEISMVLLIIGILLTMVFPIAGQLRERSRKAQAVSAMRAIANAYRQYMIDLGHPIRWSDLKAISGRSDYDVSLIAGELERTGYLKDVDAWVWDFDYKFQKYKGKGGKKLQQIFDGTKVRSEFRRTEGIPFGVAGMVAKNSLTADDFLDYAESIPVVYSRGLGGCQSSTYRGKWIDKSVKYKLGGVFGSSGGFVAYLDGHVVWYDNLGTSSDGKIKKYGKDEFSNVITDGLPNGSYDAQIDSGTEFLLDQGGGVDCLQW